MSADKPNHGRKAQPRSDFRRLSRRFMSGLLRSLFFINNSTRYSRAGFVLPTTVLLLLVMTLTVGALSFRSFSRTQSVSIAREQEVIDNVAAPAVDRAKAKLEYLFAKDSRLPGTGTPSSDILSTLMLNVDSIGTGGLGITRLGRDPYTLPDERRLNINGTTNGSALDNAWSFNFDVNGDGTIQPGETIAYSILMDDAVDINNTPNNRADDIKIEDTGMNGGVDANVLKARNLVTRNGPINTAAALASCGGARQPQQGWISVTAAVLEKNFQITAFASNGSNTRRANSALELQQVRRALQGNRWGAWFKYDMEVHPGPEFNWNGAIHTDGNMMVTNNLRAHMISSHNSCLYTQDGSAITMAQEDNDGNGINTAGGIDFEGQLVAGVPGYGDMNSRGTPRLHIFTNLGQKPIVDEQQGGSDVTRLTSSNDSVQGNSFNDLMNIALDPVALFTQNVSQHRGTGWQRASNWPGNAYATGRRVINQSLVPPYLDDFFRADNRYGPRPSYDKNNWVKSTANDGVINTTANDPNRDKRVGEEILSTDDSGDNLINQAGGLDGYWERQAINTGMRVVVGQRLELGNHLDWNFDAVTRGFSRDPLYPPTPSNTMANKQKQRVTLRDNLAAVQGMVVYHYDRNGNFPMVCIANTAHPGTIETLRASRTFTNYPVANTLKANFLGGEGTNGWEFSFPSAFDTEAEFGTELSSTNPLGVALRNLAYFAGDPRGGAPSFTPVQDTVVHPFPQQAMWGDYSVLRRIFDDQLDNTTGWRSVSNPPSLSSMSDRYNALSPADKSSLHSAACTLGLLAYNLSSQQAAESSMLQTYIPNQGTANTIGAVLLNTLGISNSGPTGSAAAGCIAVVNPSYEYDCSGLQIDKEAVITASGMAPNRQTAVRLVGSLEQIKRDRTYGFRTPSNTTLVPYIGKRGPTSYLFRIPSECNPDNPDGIVADLFEGIGNGLTDSKAMIALMCAPTAPKYPSLYYLFPKTNHDQLGTGLHAQPTTEEYINQTYLTDVTTGVNRSNRVTYRVVGDNGSIPAVEDPADSGIGAIAFPPITNTNNWPLPRGSSAGTGVLNPESMNIRLPNNQLLPLSLLEKAMYNGREEMVVRVLDVDLGRLTQNRTGGTGTDYWISDDQNTNSGIFYAAREDAVREDAIVRPASVSGGSTTTWTDCNTLTNVLNTNRCWMRANRTAASGGSVDPPLSRRQDGSFVGISVKPVDFAPDPDRRPHGFRLNANLDNNRGDLSNRNNRTWGLTFITDNAAYIKGQFNPHTRTGGNSDTLEEFTQTLFNGNVGFGNPFYNSRTTLNTSLFATTTEDRWRVTEILADAVYVVSNNFVDGAVPEGFIRNRNQNSPDFGNSRTSFHNQQRPLQNNGDAWPGDWLRIDGSYNAAVPIWVGSNGESRLRDGTSFTNFNNAVDGSRFELPDERDPSALIGVPSSERMNATIISGLVPSRSRQGYGGLHNFPRFLENWTNQDLFIQGAFLQLNFSTASTGPFDADAWDPGENPVNDERIGYYRPPGRRWGYDVGLQYATAGPIAQRFVQVDRPRSEHYRELSIEDPYVTNLRCSEMVGDANGVGNARTRRFPTETCP